MSALALRESTKLDRWRVGALGAAVVYRLGTVGASFVVAVHAGPTAFAPVALLLILNPFGSMVASFGSDQALFRTVAAQKHPLNLELMSALKVCAMPALLALPIAFAFAFIASFFSYSCALFSVAGLCAALEAYSVLIVAGYYRAVTDVRRYIAVLVSVTIAGTATRLVLMLVVGIDPLTSWILGDVAIVLVSLPLLLRWLASLRDKSPVYKLGYRKTVAFGGPMTLHGCFQWLLGSSDRFVIGAVLGSAALGTYGAVYQFSGIYNAAASEINKTGLHRYAEGKAGINSALAITRDQRSLLLIWVLGLAPEMIALYVLQNAGYSGAVTLGMTLYLSFVPLVIYLPLANELSVTHGAGVTMSVASGIGALLNIAVNVALVWFVGLYSGAIANVVGYTGMALVLLLRKRALTNAGGAQ
ncbi:oligosaccharide flippase family protein [Gordonia sp. VNK1]|uniref:oligosaccharide flippase family protein n=1 Tax=Gordonia oleivorans TaxID=3156618 RepID=UPI0032B4AF37